ncbi:DMT family transporter [Bailinhaonella thermotolerans]|uniref:DMT family transporter n=2 Tax=Bailinhaonella thermotolerans TaxID=1070861 RepID=A0A3A4AX48_9ACTN|nr:DMT family transporter [Bailinhaonella thermotolerans]
MPLKGLILAVVSACAFGASGSMAKLLSGVGVTSLQAVWVRLAAAGLVMIVGLAVLRPKALRVPAGRGRFFALYSVVAVAGPQAFYFAAVSRLPVGIALLLEYTSPLIVLLWVRLVRRVRLPRVAVIGAITAMAGLAAVVEVWDGLQLDALGVLLGLGAATCAAGYFLLSDSVQDDVDPLGLIAWGLAGASLVLLPISRPWQIDWTAFGDPVTFAGLTAPAAVPLAWMVLISTVLAFATGVAALRLLSAAVGATVATLEAIMGALIAWIVLAETLSPTQIAGALLVLTGAALAQRATAPAPAPAQDPHPEPAPTH